MYIGLHKTTQEIYFILQSIERLNPGRINYSLNR